MAAAAAPAKRRGVVVAAVVASVAAVVVIGLVVGAVLLARAGARNSASPVAPVRTGASGGSGPSATSPTPAGARHTLNAPDQMGSLKKAADQSAVEGMGTSMAGGGIGNSFAVEYLDSANGNRPVLVWGATGGLFGLLSPQAQLDAFFAGARKEAAGGAIGDRTTADPGSVGGAAQCSGVTGTGSTVTLCAWSGGDALVGVIFLGVSTAAGAGQLHTILPAIVTKN